MTQKERIKWNEKQERVCSGGFLTHTEEMKYVYLYDIIVGRNITCICPTTWLPVKKYIVRKYV